MEQAIFDGWRYLGLDSSQILSKTPREFSILMAAHTERIYDEYERLATQAIWNRSAYHAKKLKYTDLFKRPNGIDDNRTADDVRERQKAIMERLEKFEEFKGKFDNEKGG